MASRGEEERVEEDEDMERMRKEAGLGEEEWRMAVQEARWFAMIMLLLPLIGLPLLFLHLLLNQCTPYPVQEAGAGGAG